MRKNDSGAYTTASTESQNPNFPKDRAMSMAIPQYINILTIGKSNHQANDFLRPMICAHSAKLTPGIQAFLGSEPARRNKGARDKITNKDVIKKKIHSPT